MRTRAELEAMLSPSAIDRVLAHEKLSASELVRLYATPNKQIRARELRLCAKRIRACEEQGLRMSELCKELGERTLVRLFRASTNAEEVLRLLLSGKV